MALLRYITEELGFTITYDADTRIIDIIKGDKEEDLEKDE